jgi:nicotinamide mononucleotide transporter PnuC
MTLYTPLNVIGLCGILFYSAEFVPPEFSFIKTLMISIGAAIVTTLILGNSEKKISNKWPTIFPIPDQLWPDAATTAASLVATILLILWSPVAWIFWVLIDIAAIIIYLRNKSYVVMISYILYSLNAIRGFINWIQPGVLPF